MTEDSSPLEAIRRLYVARRTGEVRSLAESTWFSYLSSVDPDSGQLIPLGETLRIASIAARGDGNSAEAEVWLSRARALFVQARSETGIALTMLVDVYEALDRYGPGSTVLAMLDAVESAVGEAEEPMPRAEVLALVAEKRAFVLLEQALPERTAAGLRAAGSEYQRALTLVRSDARRRLKLRAAIVTVDIVARAISVEDAITRLDDLLDEADGAGLDGSDVGLRLQENLRRLRSGRTDLQSYETFAGSR